MLTIALEMGGVSLVVALLLWWHDYDWDEIAIRVCGVVMLMAFVNIFFPKDSAVTRLAIDSVLALLMTAGVNSMLPGRTSAFSRSSRKEEKEPQQSAGD